ncbi:MAG: hypothetical protein NC205_00965 [Prevotella sp.]|nr:hypothetical protein [Alistipes senegalensis]MCM1357134.1 hypothetical protein [Prevotella sp.]
MTGTGTAEAPYIVDNWADYRQIYTESAYIEWDGGATKKVIDFNKICPEGFTTQIKFSKYTKFNGWKFENLFTTSSAPLFFGAAGAALDGFILENFYWIPPASNIECVFLNFEANHGNISTLKNCVISGKIEALSSCRITTANFHESSANIAVNSGDFTISSHSVRNSEIILDISAPTVKITPEIILNSRFSGKIATENPVVCGSEASGYNVFDINSTQPLEYSGKGVMVYNSGKTDATGTGNHKPCTSEQLKNPEYLNSIRFPIGVD